jgi:hypothetical protein
MRIGENAIYSNPYGISSKNSSTEAYAASSSSSIPVIASVGVEVDMSAKALTSNLWLLQTDVYYSRDAEKAAANKQDFAAQFKELSEQTVAERIREDYLERHGLTEEDLAALPDEERQAVEDEIQQLIKRQLGFDETTAGEDVAQIA